MVVLVFPIRRRGRTRSSRRCRRGRRGRRGRLVVAVVVAVLVVAVICLVLVVVVVVAAGIIMNNYEEDKHRNIAVTTSCATLIPQSRK